MTFTVQRVMDLRTLDLTQLVNESEAEGYRFLSRLVNEYKDGSNTFSEPGEALFLIQDETGKVAAIGGVNQSPFFEESQVGRLHRFYVADDARRQGLGSLLLKEIVNHSRETFNELTVRTESSKADAFYRYNGFELDDSASETTHVMALR